MTARRSRLGPCTQASSSSSSRMGDYGSSSSSSYSCYGERRHSQEQEEGKTTSAEGGSIMSSRNFLPPLAFESQSFSASASGTATGNGGWSQQLVQRSPHAEQYQRQQPYHRTQQYDDRPVPASPAPSSASSHGRSSTASQHQARFASILSDDRRDSVAHFSHADLTHPSGQYARPASSSGGRHSPHWRSFEEARPTSGHAQGTAVSLTSVSGLAPASVPNPENRLGLHFGPGASSSSGVAPGDTPLRKSCQHCR